LLLMSSQQMGGRRTYNRPQPASHSTRASIVGSAQIICGHPPRRKRSLEQFQKELNEPTPSWVIPSISEDRSDPIRQQSVQQEWLNFWTVSDCLLYRLVEGSKSWNLHIAPTIFSSQGVRSNGNRSFSWSGILLLAGFRITPLAYSSRGITFA
jgi:hypothetical protein